jgi:hypothetical protein
MKKLLISLLIMVIVGGVVFYFGWVQLQLPANSAGVIFTKTNGWEAEPVRAGDFEWRWQRVLPTNFTLYVYPVEPYNAEIRQRGTLPSAEIYASALEDEPDFSYDIQIDLTFVVRPESLPLLASEQGVLPEALSSWYETTAREISLRAEELLLPGNGTEGSLPASSAELEAQIREPLSSEFEMVEFRSISPRRFRVPDSALYERAREIYLAGLETRRDTITAQTRADTAQDLQTERRFETLRRYGEILSDFPVLLEYFLLTTETGTDPLELNELRSLLNEVEQTQAQ